VHSPVANADAPNLGVWAASQQAFRSCEGILSYFECAGLHIDGNDLALIACLYLRTHLLFVDCYAEPGVLFFTETWLPYGHGFPPFIS
jgi:hypothetical protein